MYWNWLQQQRRRLWSSTFLCDDFLPRRHLKNWVIWKFQSIWKLCMLINAFESHADQSSINISRPDLFRYPDFISCEVMSSTLRKRQDQYRIVFSPSTPYYEYYHVPHWQNVLLLCFVLWCCFGFARLNECSLPEQHIHISNKPHAHSFSFRTNWS